MSFFNYHAKAKNLIKSGHLVAFRIVEQHNNIKPALVLYFTNNKPIPIRDYMWNEYIPLINERNIPINNCENINLQ